MSRPANYIAAIAAALFVFGSGFSPASAACKRMGFLVNDYGKDGPTSDAQILLDKHIAGWADEQGIEEYSVGKKSVKCELFLDFIVFDEHTCTASATVCWGGSRQPKTQNAKAKKKSKTKTAKAKTKNKAVKNVAKAAAKKTAVVKTVATKAEKVKPTSTGAVETSAIPQYVVAEDAPTQTSASPAVPYAKNAVIRNTGAPTQISDPVTTARAAPKPAAPTSRNAVASERAAADRAAAAAERAAAAAERAAAAAQLAAEAAKQAAAVGLSARSAVVAPVTPTKTP